IRYCGTGTHRADPFHAPYYKSGYQLPLDVGFGPGGRRTDGCLLLSSVSILLSACELVYRVAGQCRDVSRVRITHDTGWDSGSMDRIPVGERNHFYSSGTALH